MANANAMNKQSFDINSDSEIKRIQTYYNNDMNLCNSNITLNDEAFLNLLALQGSVDYITTGFGTARQIVWKYDGDSTVYRMEVVMNKSALAQA